MSSAPLETLRRQYFSLLPPRLIDLPPAATLSSIDGQTFLVEQLLQIPSTSEASHAAKSPAMKLQQPENGYKRLFWRKVVQAVEDGLGEVDDDEAEVHEALYENLAELMAIPTSTASEPPPSYRSFIYDIPPSPLDNDESSAASTTTSPQAIRVTAERTKTITLVEEQTVLQGGTTGLRTWTAALRLAAHILTHPHLLFPTHPLAGGSTPASSQEFRDGAILDGRSVIELGAGTGFLAVLLAQLGPEVVATDLDVGPGDSSDIEASGSGMERQAPLDRLRSNVAHNTERDAPRHQIRVEALDWFDSYKPLSEQPQVWHDLRRPAFHEPSGIRGGAEGKSVAQAGRTIIAADVIYDPDLVPALVHTIYTLITPISADHEQVQVPGEAVIAATVRNVETLDLFERVCHNEGLRVQQLDLPPLDMAQPVFWDSGLDAGSEVRIMRITLAP